MEDAAYCQRHPAAPHCPRGPGAWRRRWGPRVGGRGSGVAGLEARCRRCLRSAAASVLSSPDAAGFLSVPESAPGTHARAPSAASPLACPLSFLLCPRMGTGDALSHPARCSWRLSFWGTSWYQVPGVFFAPAEASVVEVPVIFHSGHLMTRMSGLTGTGQSLALGTPRGAGVVSAPARPRPLTLLSCLPPASRAASLQVVLEAGARKWTPRASRHPDATRRGHSLPLKTACT